MGRWLVGWMVDSLVRRFLLVCLFCLSVRFLSVQFAYLFVCSFVCLSVCLFVQGLVLSVRSSCWFRFARSFLVSRSRRVLTACRPVFVRPRSVVVFVYEPELSFATVVVGYRHW